MLKRVTPEDDAHSTTVAEADDARRVIADAREAMAMWDARAGDVIASLPPSVARTRLEERRAEEARTAATIWPTIEQGRRVDLADERRGRAEGLFHEAKGMRAELVEEPLREVIRQAHGCACRYVESTAVADVVVHTFDLIGHANAAQAYAWSSQTGTSEARSFAVLALPPITGPQGAVAAQARSLR